MPVNKKAMQSATDLSPDAATALLPGIMDHVLKFRRRLHSRLGWPRTRRERTARPPCSLASTK